jgi:hypothetical protein
MTDAQRAHERLQKQLADRTTTHRRPEPVERRGQNMTPKQMQVLSRAGRANGPKARLRKPKRHGDL